MTDTPAPAPAPAFIQPPDYATTMEAEAALNGLIRTLGARMPDPIYNALAPKGGAGQGLQRLEESCEALYDWACNAAECPDDARRVAHGVCFVMNAHSFNNFGKSPDGVAPSRAALQRLEHRRQLGDTMVTQTQAERPAPSGSYIAAPVAKMMSMTEDHFAALVGKLVTVKDGLASGSMTTAEAAAQLDEVHAAVEGMTAEPLPAPTAAA